LVHTGHLKAAYFYCWEGESRLDRRVGGIDQYQTLPGSLNYRRNGGQSYRKSSFSLRMWLCSACRERRGKLIEWLPPARNLLTCLTIFSLYPQLMRNWFMNVACSRQVLPRRVNRLAPEIMSVSSETISALRIVRVGHKKMRHNFCWL
jgi:hypothetical protein